MNVKEPEIVLLRTSDSRWWGQEHDVASGNFRWTSARSRFRVMDHLVISVDVLLEYNPSNTKEIAIWQKDWRVICLRTKEGVHFNVTEYSDFEIVSHTFVPREIDPSIFTDPRTLGVKVKGFILRRGEELLRVDIKDIPVVYEAKEVESVEKRLREGIITEAIDYTPNPFNIAKPKTHGALFYMDKPYPRFEANLAAYKRSKTSPLVTFSDNPSITADIKLDPLYSKWNRKYEYAFLAFQKGVEIAKSRGWDYFMWAEWDSYIGKDYWYDTLWDELISWPYEPLSAGTPTVAIPNAFGNFGYMVQNYIAGFIKQNKVCMHVATNRPFFLAVNGGMGFFKTEQAYRYLIEIPTPEYISPDVLFGQRMFEEHGENILKHTAWLPSMYSGWGEQDYTEAQRKEMVDSGFKVLMHQYKVV